MAGDPHSVVVCVIDRLERSGCNGYSAINCGSRNRKWVPKGIAVIAIIGMCCTNRNKSKHKKSCPDTC